MVGATWVITGADGFFGNNIVRALSSRGEKVVAAVFGSLEPASLSGVDCIRVPIDVTQPETVQAALATASEQGGEIIVVHCASIVSIADKVDPLLHATNVGGTRNVIAACRAAKVSRLVHVSTVHAIPEPDDGPIREITDFDSTKLHGAYAITKAEATALVLAADDLDRVVVQPSGIIGPGDYGDGPMSRLIRDLVAGKLPVIVGGGYDFVDVRDATEATLVAAERGRNGECYLLAGGRSELHEIATVVAEATGARVPPRVPEWVAKIAVPFVVAIAKIRRVRPLFTRYSLYTVFSKGTFSHDKASAELGFNPRPIRESILDTVAWVSQHQAGTSFG